MYDEFCFLHMAHSGHGDHIRSANTENTPRTWREGLSGFPLCHYYWCTLSRTLILANT